MSKINVNLNTDYLKKNGEAAIYFRITLEYDTVRFKTGICCKPDEFDAINGRIKGNSRKAKDHNMVIEKGLSLFNEIFIRYRLQNLKITAKDLKNEYTNPSRRIDFYSFFDEAIKERKSELRPQTYKNHQGTLKKLKEFSKTLYFSEINHDFLDRLTRWMKTKKKNDINTIHSNMKFLRAYLNIAVRKDIIKENPFKNYIVKRADPERVFLTKDELFRIWDLYCDGTLPEKKQNILRHYLFMCFTGVRISDLKRLTAFEINRGMLVYSAMKTKGIKLTYIKVPLTKYARQLIKDENSQSDLLFNTISEQKMNDYIKEIAVKADVFKPLTNHSARHTFATTWLEVTHDLASLKEMLGHSKITDTMRYVHITEESMKSQMKKFEVDFVKEKNPVPLTGFLN